MAYSLDNLRPQCYRCNIHLSGNWPAFERHLEQEMGFDFPSILKRRNEQSKGKMYRLDWFINKINEYERLLKENE